MKFSTQYWYCNVIKMKLFLLVKYQYCMMAITHLQKLEYLRNKKAKLLVQAKESLEQLEDEVRAVEIKIELEKDRLYLEKQKHLALVEMLMDILQSCPYGRIANIPYDSFPNIIQQLQNEITDDIFTAVLASREFEYYINFFKYIPLTRITPDQLSFFVPTDDSVEDQKRACRLGMILLGVFKDIGSYPFKQDETSQFFYKMIKDNDDMVRRIVSNI